MPSRLPFPEQGPHVPRVAANGASGHSHGENGGHTVQRGDEDAGLTDQGRQQQGPRGLPVGLPVAKHLPGERQVGWGPRAGGRGGRRTQEKELMFRREAELVGSNPKEVSELRQKQSWTFHDMAWTSPSHVQEENPTPREQTAAQVPSDPRRPHRAQARRRHPRALDGALPTAHTRWEDSVRALLQTLGPGAQPCGRAGLERLSHQPFPCAAVLRREIQNMQQTQGRTRNAGLRVGCQSGGGDVGPTVFSRKDHAPGQDLWPLLTRSFQGGVGGVPCSRQRAHLQERDDAIPGDGLQQAWGPCQALQASPAGGEEGPNDDDPGRRPGQHANDEVPLQGLPEPGGAASFQTRAGDRNLLPPAEWGRPLPGAPAPQLYRGLRSLCGPPAPGLSGRQMHRSDPNTWPQGHLRHTKLEILGFSISKLKSPSRKPALAPEIPRSHKRNALIS